MGLLDFFIPKTKINGKIGYFGLEEWWLSEFTYDEQKYILDKFISFGITDNSLIKGQLTVTDQSKIDFLSSLAGWFYKEEDRTIGYRLISKAEKFISEKTDILDLHFLFSREIELYYKNRNRDSFALEKAIKACKKQIQISNEAANAFKTEYKNVPLPCHSGYKQLAIIKEKDKKFDEAISLANLALKQGWDGDWDKRIERCNKKKEKQQNLK